MKLLFVYKEIKNTNLYVPSLKNALCDAGLQAVCSIDEFWNNYQNYDIIHIQWPESIIAGIKTRSCCQKFINHFDNVKTQCKIIVTCHNIEPHRKLNKYTDLLYEYVYSNCDAMIHLGQFSYDYLKRKLPLAIKHTIIPHHIYNNDFIFSMDKLAARKRLNIPEEVCVILCFGVFRNHEERKLVLKAYKNTDIPNKRLLVPGFFIPQKIGQRKNPVVLFREMLKLLYYKLFAFCNGFNFNSNLIEQSEVEVYFCAADIVMIQRYKILNSGSLSMGFYAGKVVVGPNIGNVGVILKERGNPVFDPFEKSSVIAAIKRGFSLSKTDLGQKNSEYARLNWNVESVANRHIEFYNEVLKIV